MEGEEVYEIISLMIANLGCGVCKKKKHLFEIFNFDFFLRGWEPLARSSSIGNFWAGSFLGVTNLTSWKFSDLTQVPGSR
jgi:hypothetical protein